MDRHHSTLELARHDETTQAPERDYDATAFEFDCSALAPEIRTVPDITPEVLYDSTLPQAYNNEKPTEDRLNDTRRARKWPWIIVALILAVAIAIGVSVGVWHRREHSMYTPSTTSSPPAPNITHTPQYILNDTSLAAVSRSNADRHLFFQDNTGLIRRAVRVESNGQWTTSPNLNTITDSSSKPKRHTPLTATGPTYAADMSLYYISEDGIVASNVLSEAQGSWFPYPDLGNYSTAVDTRSLSISLFPLANNSSSLNTSENATTNVALLFYENPNGKVSTLLYRLVNTFNSPHGLLLDQWINITSQESKALPNEFHNAPGFNYSNTLYNLCVSNITCSQTLDEADPNAVYSTPFFSAPNYLGSIGAMFYSPLNAPSTSDGDSFVTITYMIGLNSSGNFSLMDSTPASDDYSSIHQSDIAPFGSNYALWINGTQPALIPTRINDAVLTLPSNDFPFKRLASVTLTDGSATYLYHQMNGTTFAEEQWHNALRDWLPTEYITVSDS